MDWLLFRFAWPNTAMLAVFAVTPLALAARMLVP